MSEKPSLHLIGNAHLDPIWLWRWQEGCGEVLQTFRSALDRLNEYPDFVFTCSSAAYYRWVEEIAPDMFAEIKKRVEEGRWVPVNGWWVQPDCNMPSGESFARHALYSQLYYHEKFGVICRTGYNVDSFGHNGMVPQLLKLGGMNAYVMMRPGMHENPDIPENLFWWQSPDGTKVLTYRIPTGYGENGEKNLTRAISELEKRIDNTGHGMMLFYGVGNHGGGPTRSDIEFLRRKTEDENGFEIKFSSPDDYFKEILESKPELPVWSDDLQHHASGCYSVTSEVKKLNRLAENALASAEKWNTIASKVADLPAGTKEFTEAWKDVLFNQFHDVLCGCSIMEAYDDVRESMGHAMTIAARAQNSALLKLSRRIDTWIDGVSDPVNVERNCVTEVRHNSAPGGFPRPVVVFNPLSYPVTVPVQTYQPSEMVKDSEGNLTAFQNVRSSRSNDTHLDTVFLAKLPALGYATYWLYPRTNENGAVKTSVRVDGLTMENEFIRVRFDRQTGCISQLIDNKTGYGYLSGQGARPVVIDDVKTDTWAHGVFRFHDIKGYMELVSIKLVESGPLRAVIRVKHRYNNSFLTQNFILAEGQKVLRVTCKVIWQEPHTMLKMAFPLAGTDEISTYEIPNAYIKRPCNGEEEPGQQWADLTVTAGSERRGVSIITDSKYSFDCPGAELRLTALRNAIFADHFSHRPDADFNYTDEGLQRFEYGIYPHSGEVEATDIAKEAAAFNNRPVAVPIGYHKGCGEPRIKSYLTINSEADDVIATAFKLSEDGSGSAIIRFYETKGKKTRALIKCELLGVEFYSELGPHEIKTCRIEPDGKIYVVNFLEGIVK